MWIVRVKKVNTFVGYPFFVITAYKREAYNQRYMKIPIYGIIQYW